MKINLDTPTQPSYNVTRRNCPCGTTWFCWKAKPHQQQTTLWEINSKSCAFWYFSAFCRLRGTDAPTQFTRTHQICPVDSGSNFFSQRVYSRFSDVVAANKVLRHADDSALNPRIRGGWKMAGDALGNKVGPEPIVIDGVISNPYKWPKIQGFHLQGLLHSIYNWWCRPPWNYI